jgi:hypothetical protein
MFKNVIFYIALALAILNVSLIFKCKRIKEIYEEEETIYKNGLSVLASKVDFYKSLYKLSFENYNYSVNLSQEAYVANDTLNLYDIFKKGNSYLVFKYSYKDCSTCIDKVYQKLDYYKDYLPLKTVVITSQRNLRDLISEQNIKAKSIPVYLLAGDSICKIIDDINSPILFIVNEQQKISSIFKIDSSGEFLDDFFSIIKYYSSTLSPTAIEQTTL